MGNEFIQGYNLIRVQGTQSNDPKDLFVINFFGTQLILSQQGEALGGGALGDLADSSIHRQWIINSSGSPITIKFNNVPYLFNAGSIYCTDAQEAQFFKERSGGGLTTSTGAAWIVAGAVKQTFYW